MTSKDPIIFIPGIMGTSIVRHDGTSLWPPIGIIPTPSSRIRALALDQNGNDIYKNRASPKDVIRNIKVSLGVTIYERPVYSNFYSFFAKNGYAENKSLFSFPYDWRKDLRLASSQLAKKVEQVKKQTDANKVILIAHSMGGLVARHYLSDNGNWSNIEKLFMLATPHHGAPKAFLVLRYGQESPIPSIFASSFDVMATTGNMPGLYTLLPSHSYERLNGGGFFIYNGKRYSVDETYFSYGGINSKLAKDALRFHQDVYDAWRRSPFPQTYLMIGKRGPHSTFGTIKLDIKGTKVELKYKNELKIEGDETVPLLSAEKLNVNNDRKFYFNVEHENMATNNSVLQKVLEIIRSRSVSPKPKNDSVESYPENPGPLPVLDLKNKSQDGKGPLVRGDLREDLVRHLQKILVELGYDLGKYGIDGKFGGYTEQAVRTFQRKHRDYKENPLEVDGIVGPLTADALNKALIGKWYKTYNAPFQLREIMI